MRRLTISIDDETAEAFEQLLQANGYTNRSEAVRDMVRGALCQQTLIKDKDTPCVAIVSYVYDHHKLQLSQRMIELQHDEASLVVSSMHVHVNHSDCAETLVLKGPAGRIEYFAKTLIAERGIIHGQVNIIPVQIQTDHH